MISAAIEDYLKHMKLGDHAVVFYDSVGHNHEVLLSFLEQAAPDQALAYICGDQTTDEIRSTMRNRGFEVDAMERSGRLTIRNCNEWYILNGDCAAERIIDQWAALARKAASKGYKSMRVTGEVTCFFRNQKVKELVRYEYSLHRRVDLPMEVLCAYNVVEMGLSGYLDFIVPFVRTHDPAIFTGPNGSFLVEPERVEDHDVEGMMQIQI